MPPQSDPTKYIDLELLKRKLLPADFPSPAIEEEEEEEEKVDDPLVGIDVDALEKKLLSKESRTKLRAGEEITHRAPDKPLSGDTEAREGRLMLRDPRYRDLVRSLDLQRLLELRKKKEAGAERTGLGERESEELKQREQTERAAQELSKRRKEGRTKEGGGWQKAEDITRAIKKTATGEYVLEAAGLTPEMAKEYSREGGKMTGFMIGTARGIELAAKLPDPKLKALAIAGGGVVGGILGAAPSDPLRPMTPGEMAELGTYSAGTGSMLYQIPAKALIPRVLIGGSEAALITETAGQLRSVLDEGKPLPMELKTALQRQVVPFLFGGAAMGAMGPKPKLTGLDVSDIAKARNDVISLYKRRIEHHQKLQRARKGGKKTEQKEIVKTLKADLDAIYNNPSVMLDVSKPELMARTAVMLRQREEVLRLAKNEQEAAERAAFDHSMEYLNSMGKEKALSRLEELVKSGDAVPSAVKEGAGTFGGFNKEFRVDPAGMSETKGILTQDLGRGISPWTIRKDGEWLPAWRGYGPSTRGGLIPFSRMYLGFADVLEEAGRLSKSKNPLANEAAKRIRNNFTDGDQYSGIAKGKLLRKAHKLGFDRIGKSKETDRALDEFAKYQEMRHSDNMQDVKGDIPSKMEYIDGKVVTSRVDRAPNFYESMSPMGKALVDGWDDAAGWFGKEMRKLEVKVVDANGKVREAHTPEGYWPIRLKAVYENALRNPTSEAPHIKAALKEMHEALGTKSIDELEKRLRGLAPEDLTGFDKKTGEVKFEDQLSGMFNHLERGRSVEGVPVQLLDFELELGQMYLGRGGGRLAEIKNFNQPFMAGKDDLPVPNPDYMWNALRKVKDPTTRQYIVDGEKAMFDPARSKWEWANRATTVGMIANQKSAIKNLTGIAKPWLFTRTPQYLEGALRSLMAQTHDLAHAARIVGSKSRTAEIAEDVQAVGKEIANRVQFLQAKESADTMGRVDRSTLGKLWEKGTGGKDITGGMLNISGFTPAEDFTRKFTISIAEVNRKAIMRQIGKAPDASKIMELRLALEKSGLDSPGRAAIEGKIADLTGKPQHSAPLYRREGEPKIGEPFMAEARTPDELARNARFDEAARFAAKNDVDLIKIRDEGIAQRSREKAFIPEEHPETLKWYQAYNREAQGGYQVDQLPLFMQDPMGKVIFKFKNWSQQMQRTFDRHVLDEARKEGNYRPLFKWVATQQIAGEVLNPVLSSFFGRERSDAEWKEIGKAFNEDEGGKALQMLLIRAAANASLSGMWDMWGSMFGDRALRFTERGKLDDVSDIAALAQLDMLQQGLQRWFDSGFDRTTALDIVKSVSLANQTANVIGVLTGDKVKRYQGKLMPRLRRLQDEFLEKKRNYGVEIQFDESTPMKRELRSALFNGDSQKAAEIYSNFLQDKIDGDEYILAQEPELRKQLQRVVRQSQPIKVGGAYSKERVNDFVEFLEGTGWGGLGELKALQDSYIKTAVDAGILDPEKGESEIAGPIAEGRRVDAFSDAKAKKFFEQNKNMPPKKYDTKLMTRFGVHRLQPLPMDASPEETGKRITEESIIRHARGLYLNKGKDDVAAQVLLHPDYRKISNKPVRAKYMWDTWKKQEIPHSRIRSFMNKLGEFDLISKEEALILNKELISDSLRGK